MPIAILLLAVVVWGEAWLNNRDPSDSGSSCGLERKLTMPGKEHQNRLAREKSPYLLQHAENPVDWYPWGEEAFERARREDKPIFLSIGYSTCHWCHVMEHESFEDSAVAALMNAAFVSIKVDREERPDIDNLYMGICQMMTGSGGWPLTIIMTPDKKPFYAATYIPRENAYGRMGMLQLIPRISDLWRERRDEAVGSADHISSLVREAAVTKAGPAVDRATIEAAVQGLRGRYDSRFGGFSQAPKFPSPHNLTLLLRYWNRTGDSTSLAMVEQTLQAMRAGGIYDHIGFGFHRYSTDQKWLVPHFEKMLYDQAMLIMAYTEAYQATGNPDYAKVVGEIVTYVLRDLTSPEGAFYSAEDADSEGEEGRFYVWTTSEVRDALTGDDADLANKVFNITADGNFVDQATRGRNGTNIPHLQQPLDALAASSGLSPEEISDRLEALRARLLEVRSRRVRPHRDDKVLTDWNGLMIAALAKAAQALDRPEYAKAAAHAADFVLANLRDSKGRLLHRYRDGEAGLPAHVDDYAFMTWGLLELYEATFDLRRLETALELTETLVQHHWDGISGGFYFTADDGEGLLARQKETYDGAIPSGNSVAMLNLVRLGRMTGQRDLEEKAAAIGRAFSEQVRGTPSAHCQMLQGVDFLLGPSYEIVICGGADAPDTHRMIRAIASRFIPSKVTLLKTAGTGSDRLAKAASYTQAMTPIGNQATAYVCREFSCQQPTTDLSLVLKFLGVEESTASH